jgi:hypothetical protein
MSPDKFIGTTTRDIFPPYEAEKIEAYDKVVKTEGVAVETDDWPDKFQGQARWWKEIKFPIKLPSGDMLIGGIAFEITERKQREEKMQMMQFAMDHAMDRIAWIAPDGRFLARRWSTRARRCSQGVYQILTPISPSKAGPNTIKR